MATPIQNIFRRGAGVATLLLALLVGLQVPAIAAPPSAAPAAGAARIYIYRDDEPWQTLATPYIRFNGAVIGISRPAAVLYRDVAPGRYRVTVDSDGIDVHQFATIDVAPGDTAYIKVESLNGWDSGGGGSRGSGWARDTFYTRLMPDQLAVQEMARLPLYGG